MRRAFVIFLILLFPLNVLALSLSVATAETHATAAQADLPAASDSLLAQVFDADTPRDLDPDEPPAMDLHDIVNHEAGLRLTTLPGRAGACHDARHHRLALPPPIKPPRHV